MRPGTSVPRRGPIRNAYDPRRHASGSSGGSASGVTGELRNGGIGEDTGGSVRGPAAVEGPRRPQADGASREPPRHDCPRDRRPTRWARSPHGRDAAILLDVIAGYDPSDPVTAQAVGKIPKSYSSSLAPDGLRGARLGVIRQPMDAKADPASEDYRKVRTVIDMALGESAKARGRNRRPGHDSRSDRQGEHAVRRELVRDRAGGQCLSWRASERPGEDAARHPAVRQGRPVASCEC